LSGPRRARSRFGPQPGQADPSRPPTSSAKDRALRLLAVRWRSREELRRRLAGAGFEETEVDRALRELEGAGLIDDVRFAGEVVRSHAGGRLAGDRAIRTALRRHGVAAEVAESALAGAGAELDRAIALADRRAARLAHLGVEAAHRRLFGLLVRRGYGSEVAASACRQALTHVFGPSDSADEGV
jgi:regulatory protein